MTQGENTAKQKPSIYKRLKKLFRIVILSLLTVIILLFIPPIQSFLIQNILPKSLGISYSNLYISPFGEVQLQEALIVNPEGDTLIDAEELNVSINLIPLLQKAINIQDINLRNAQVNLSRNPNTYKWNYAYLINPKPKSNTTTFQFSIQPNRVVLDSVQFNYFDGKKNDSLSLDIARNFLLIDSINLSKPAVYCNIASIDLNEVFYKKTNYAQLDSLISTQLTSDLANKNRRILPFQLEFRQLELSSIYSRIQPNRTIKKSVSSLFNETDIELSELYLNADFAKFGSDTIIGKLNQLTVSDRSGFNIQNSSGDVLLTKSVSGIQAAEFEFGNSVISGDLLFTHTSLLDWNDMVNKVKFAFRIDKSQIAQSDINHFGAGLNFPFKYAQLEGWINGTVANELFLESGNIQIPEIGTLPLQLSLKNVLSTSSLAYNVKLNNGNIDLNKCLSTFGITESLNGLQTVSINTTVTGSLKNTTISGSLSSNEGNFIYDIDFANLLDSLSISGYAISDFIKVDSIFPNDYLKDIGLNTRFKVSKLHQKFPDIEVNGSFSNIHLAQASVNRLNVNGTLSDYKFSGFANIQDTIGNITFDGQLDLSDSIPEYSANLVLEEVNFSLANLNPDYTISSNINVSGSGINPLDFKGKLLAQNIRINSSFISIPISEIDIQASTNSDTSFYTLDSDYGILDLTGKFNLVNSRKYIDYLFDKYANFSVQNSYQNFYLKCVGDLELPPTLVSIFIPEIERLESIKMLAEFDHEAAPQIQTTIKNLRVLGYQIDTLNINSDQDITDEISLGVSSSNIQIPGFKVIDQFNFNLNAPGKFANCNFKVVSKELEVDLNQNITFSGTLDSFRIYSKSSYLNWRKNTWKIPDFTGLTYKHDSIQFDSLSLLSQEGNVVLYGPKYGYALKVKNFLLDNLNPILNSYSVNLGGILNIDVTPNETNLSSSLSIDSFNFNNTPIGDWKYEIESMNGFSSVSWKGASYNTNSLFASNGVYDKSGILGNVQLTNFPLNFANSFLTGVLSEMNGTINGKMNFKQFNDVPLQLNGALNLQNTTALVDEIGVKMQFEPLKVVLNKQSITAEPTFFYSEGKYGLLSLKSEIQQGSSFVFNNLEIKTEDNFPLLRKENTFSALYYGNANGEAIVNLKGPLNDLALSVTANVNRESKLSLPITSSSSTSEYDFIQFIDPKKDQNDDEEISFYNFTFLLNLSLNNSTVGNIIFNEELEDYMEFNGEGNIQISFSEFQEFTMNGSYQINSGFYQFALNNYIKRKFEIEPGGIVAFNGDPYDAQLDLIAVYNTKVRYSDISETAVQNNALVDLGVELQLRGELSAPQLDFDFRLPQSNSIVSPLNIANFQNKNEAALSLIAFNRIISSSNLTSGNANITSEASQTINTTTSDIITNQASAYLNQLLRDIGGLKNTSLNLNSNDILSGQVGLQLQSQYKRFEFAGGVNFSSGIDSNDVVSLDVYYKLRENGELRLHGFMNNNNTGFFQSDDAVNPFRFGLGVLFNRQYYYLSDFIQKEKKESQETKQDSTKQINRNIFERDEF